MVFPCFKVDAFPVKTEARTGTSSPNPAIFYQQSQRIGGNFRDFSVKILRRL